MTLARACSGSKAWCSRLSTSASDVNVYLILFSWNLFTCLTSPACVFTIKFFRLLVFLTQSYSCNFFHVRARRDRLQIFRLIFSGKSKRLENHICGVRGIKGESIDVRRGQWKNNVSFSFFPTFPFCVIFSKINNEMKHVRATVELTRDYKSFPFGVLLLRSRQATNTNRHVEWISCYFVIQRLWKIHRI